MKVYTFHHPTTNKVYVEPVNLEEKIKINLGEEIEIEIKSTKEIYYYCILKAILNNPSLALETKGIADNKTFAEYCLSCLSRYNSRSNNLIEIMLGEILKCILELKEKKENNNITIARILEYSYNNYIFFSNTDHYCEIIFYMTASHFYVPKNIDYLNKLLELVYKSE